MTNSTLGGAIRDYRLQKGLSQLDIAFALGWKEPSRLSRIEQGRTEKPSRELIDKIIKALSLEEEEKNALLLTGSYLPTKEEIERIRVETKTVLEQWPYPAVILDFSWRSIDQNKHNIQAYNITPDQESIIYNNYPRVMDILFSQSLILDSETRNEQIKQWRNYLKSIVANFKHEQKHRTKEKWYIDHIKELMRNDLFRELWVEVSERHKLEAVVGKSTQINIISPQKSNSTLNFYLFVTPVLRDPRFEIGFLIPKDLETYNYYTQNPGK